MVGTVQSSLASAVAKEVKQEQTQDPQDLLREMLRMKDLGNTYFKDNNSTMASETWSKALLKLMRLLRGGLWSRMKAESPESWSNSITEIFFQLNTNLATNTLRKMREVEKTDVELAGQYAGSVYNAAQNASMAHEMFGTSWRASTSQQAKMCYQIACAHRIARDEIDVAEQCINLAIAKFPGNASFQQEKANIARWRARQR